MILLRSIPPAAAALALAVLVLAPSPCSGQSEDASAPSGAGATEEEPAETGGNVPPEQTEAAYDDTKQLEKGLDSVKEQEAKKLLDQVMLLREQFIASQRANNARAYKAFQEALESDEKTYQFYVDCIEQIDFIEKDRPAAEFRDWRLATVSLHRTREYLGALRLHLLYLCATIRASEAETPLVAMPMLFNFMKEFRELEPMIRYPRDLAGRPMDQARQMLDGSSLDTPFATKFQLARSLMVPAGWSTSASGFDENFHSLLFPYYRKRQDGVSIATLWNRIIGMYSEFAEAAEDENDVARYEWLTEIHIPSLQWDRAHDQLRFGDPHAALASMMAMVSRRLDHPRGIEWMQELITLLQKAAGVSPLDEAAEQEIEGLDLADPEAPPAAPR